MNETNLTILVASTFMLAILIGWVLRWLFSRLNKSGLSDSNSNDLAARLHQAEEDRDRAYAERDEGLREMKNKLTQTEAELAAAMEGLGDARRAADELRREMADLRG